jgi:hypothetical protein
MQNSTQWGLNDNSYSASILEVLICGIQKTLGFMMWGLCGMAYS